MKVAVLEPPLILVRVVGEKSVSSEVSRKIWREYVLAIVCWSNDCCW